MCYIVSYFLMREVILFSSLLTVAEARAEKSYKLSGNTANGKAVLSISITGWTNTSGAVKNKVASITNSRRRSR